MPSSSLAVPRWPAPLTGGQLQHALVELADGAGQLDEGMLKLAAGQQELADGAAKLDDGIGTFAPGNLALPVGLALALVALVMVALRLRRSSQAGHAAD